jgi:hypothetical protein
MYEKTEQEKLLDLFNAGSTNPDAENFDSTDLLSQSLIEQLGRPSKEKISEVEQEIVAKGAELDYAPLTSFSSNGRQVVQAQNSDPQKDDRLIGVLRNIHASLIDVFERSGLNSGIESSLATLIDSTGACLTYLGEGTEKFEPLQHLSGLQAPNMVKNANKVIETTLNCYKLGKIEESTVSDDGSLITIVFSGKSRGIEYKVFGEVKADSWEGSEAIDYIYTPGSGSMSIKAFEGGKWIDKSHNNDAYKVNWALEERDLSLEGKDVPDLNKTASEELGLVEDEKKLDDKEEVTPTLSNNDFDDEEIGDFPIND